MTTWTKATLNRSQKLMTGKELAKIPAIMSQDGKGMNALVYVHYFSPMAGYDFWATEFDIHTGEFFGMARLFEAELGYVTAQELCSTGKVERDLYWTPKPLKECGIF